MMPKCPVCAHEDTVCLGKRSDFLDPNQLHGFYGSFVTRVDEFDREVWRCPVCGFQFIHPLYGPAEFDLLYGSEGYRRFAAQFPPLDEFESTYAKEFLEMLKNKFRVLGIPEWVEKFRSLHGNNPTFLDVGCGKGQYLLIFNQLGFDVSGIDSSRHQTEWVKARLPFKVETMLLEDLPEDRKFDCLFACHVVEHQSDPHGFMAKLMSLLSPGGIILLETPVVQDWGRAEHRYRDIYHTLFFDQFTLSLLASMHGARTLRSLNVPYREASGVFVVDVLASFERDEGLPREVPQALIRNFRASFEQVLEDFSAWGRFYLRLTYWRNLFAGGIHFLAQHGFTATVKATVGFLRQRYGKR
ncbi:MAG: class I SAM-dependent methyltransferase [Pseudomonadota bacterium]